MRNRISIMIAAFALVLAGSMSAVVSAQSAAPKQLPSNVREERLASRLMGRDMPYRVVLPAGYDPDGGKKKLYPVIYLLHGLGGSYANWTDKTGLADYVRDHGIIVVTPEGGNGWYTDSVSTPTDRFESYIISELIPEVEKRFAVDPERRGRIIAGLSMGGYGAMKFGLKYPEKFSLVGSFSGALGVASFTEKNAGTIGKGVDSILGGEDSEVRKANDIFALLRAMPADKVAGLPFIYQSCGTEDFLFENNRRFLDLLTEKKVKREYREHPGLHDWTFWDSQIREFLALAERRPAK
ncbi:MAG: esterase family protein [Acidobacteria bacterium]|nr:esterase family protein [Acidobacteriota bacterium]